MQALSHVFPKSSLRVHNLKESTTPLCPCGSRHLRRCLSTVDLGIAMRLPLPASSLDEWRKYIAGEANLFSSIRAYHWLRSSLDEGAAETDRTHKDFPIYHGTFETSVRPGEAEINASHPSHVGCVTEKDEVRKAVTVSIAVLASLNSCS